MTAVAAGCGRGGDGRDEAACQAYDQAQAWLQTASVEENPANFDKVGRSLDTLAERTDDAALDAAAAQASAGWATFRQLSTTVPRDEFTIREAYFAAIRPLEAFTTACAVVP